MTNCSACGRPLKSTASIEIGMGPTCAANAGITYPLGKHYPRKDRKIKTMKSKAPGKRFSKLIRANYEYIEHEDFLILLDENGPVSLTNFMGNAIYELYYHEKIDVFAKKIVYRDSEGVFDAILLSERDEADLTQQFYFNFNFAPLRVKNVVQAIDKYNRVFAGRKEG